MTRNAGGYFSTASRTGRGCGRPGTGSRRSSACLSSTSCSTARERASQILAVSGRTRQSRHLQVPTPVSNGVQSPRSRNRLSLNTFVSRRFLGPGEENREFLKVVARCYHTSSIPVQLQVATSSRLERPRLGEK